MVRGVKPKIHDVDTCTRVYAGARIPTEQYNKIVELVQANQESLGGARSIGEWIANAVEYCIVHDVFSKPEEYRPFGE